MEIKVHDVEMKKIVTCLRIYFPMFKNLTFLYNIFIGRHEKC